MADLLILTADELKALNSLERQAARRAARQEPLTRLILRTFLQQGGPIPVEDIIAASPGVRSDALHDALVTLDDEDLIRVRAGQIDLSVHFSSDSTVRCSESIARRFRPQARSSSGDSETDRP